LQLINNLVEHVLDGFRIEQRTGQLSELSGR